MKILSKAAGFWPSIVAHQRELAVHPFLPLHNLDGAPAAIGLAGLDVNIVPLVSSARIPAAGKVTELTASDLLELRKALYARLNNGVVIEFAEKLLKFSEIKFPFVNGLHPTLRRPGFAATLLTSFFLDYWLETKDARFLNVSWKLIDYQTAFWRGAGTGPGLQRRAAWALLCRNILLAAQGLQKL